jgi:HlyD family secretion protein
MDSPDRVALERIMRAASGRRRAPWLWTAVGVVLLAAAGLYFVGREAAPTVRYRTATVERGPLTVIVTATGTLQPTDQVDVGSELSGIVKAVHADFNDHVARGQVLASLDTTRLESQLAQSEAALAAARARIAEASANDNFWMGRLQRTREFFGRAFLS